MKTKAFGVFLAHVIAGTTVFAQMGGWQGGQGNMNHSHEWMDGGIWLWTVIGVLVVVLLVVMIKKMSPK